MKLSITKKLILVFALGLLCLAGIGYLLYHNNHSTSAKPLPPTIDQALPKALNNLRASLKDLEAAELGYALSGEEQYKTAIRTAASPGAPVHGRHEISVRGCARAASGHHADRPPDHPAGPVLGTGDRSPGQEQGRKKPTRRYRRALARKSPRRSRPAWPAWSRTRRRLPPGPDAAQERNGHSNSLLVAAAYGIVIVMVIAAIMLIGRAMPRRETRTVKGLQEQLAIYSEGLKDHASIMLDPDGRITDWNTAAQRLTGFGPADVNGRHLAALFPDEDVRLGKPDGCLKTAQAEGRCEIAGACLRKDGPPFPARWIVSAIKDEENELEGFSVLARDVTELKRAEELLTKLSLSVEQAADLVVITNREGKVEFANKAVEEVTGYTRDEFLAGGMGLLHAENNDRRDHAAMWELLLAGRQIQAEVMYARKNGEFIYLDEIATPIKDSEGSVTHVVFTGRDLTPVKLMRDKVDFLEQYRKNLTEEKSDSTLPSRLVITTRSAACSTESESFVSSSSARFSSVTSRCSAENPSSLFSSSLIAETIHRAGNGGPSLRRQAPAISHLPSA